MFRLSIQMILILTSISLINTIMHSCNQNQQCPLHSNCNIPERACRCDQGFIGYCNIQAASLNSLQQSFNISNSSLNYFYLTPIQPNRFFKIKISICTKNSSNPINLYFWRQSGKQNEFNIQKTLVPPVLQSFQTNCSSYLFPELYFYTQMNGDTQRLILGLVGINQFSTVILKVDQQLRYGVYMSVQISTTIIIFLLFMLLGSACIAICKKRYGGLLQDTNYHNTIQDNNIEYFDDLLPKIIFQQKTLQNIECPICLELIQSKQIVRKTPCQHIFHSECLDSWCIRNLTCPVCRQNLSYYQLLIINESDSQIRKKNLLIKLKKLEQQVEMSFKIEGGLCFIQPTTI